ncbi:MAG: DUF4296 domain-containing protein [Bacteroidaceae bacterium]|nr:DUF4296 domain-containing protein [Bacteroidaceae bacterium]
MIKRLLYIILCLFLLSCSEEKSDIIPPDKMEEILFDYHLAQGIIDVQPPEDYTHNQRYLDAVFSNHGITEAQFDSSMIYYTREALKLREMYVNINRRYKEIDEALKMQAGNDNTFLGLTSDGDTANIWSTGTTVVLRPAPMQNKLVFTIKNDSTLFLRRDKLRLMANAVFYKEIADDRNCYVELGITIEYRNGRTAGINRMVNYNSPVELTLDAIDDDDIRALHGFFYYTGSHTMRNLAFLTNITVIRIHDKSVPPPPPAPVDTVKTDSVIADSATFKPRTHEHLTPEQLLRKSRTKERIEIKAAPDVRTKNSYGPRRKTKKTTPSGSK